MTFRITSNDFKRLESVVISSSDEMYDLVQQIKEELANAHRIADARLELLREHYGYVFVDGVQQPGDVTPCENPDRYGRDCGKCLRCRSIYRGGALVKVIEPHTCPYKEDISGDYTTMCTCDPDQVRECQADI